MSHEEDKYRHSRRLLRDQAAIDKQLKIAKVNKIPVEAPHRGAKMHVVNCGKSYCALCANPRKVWKEKTFQELKMEQDLEE